MTAKKTMDRIDALLIDLNMNEDITTEIQDTIDDIELEIDRYRNHSDWEKAIDIMNEELKIKNYPEMAKLLDMIHKNHPEFLV